MTIYTNEQKKIAESISSDALISNWTNWKWQVKHSIRDISTFESLLGIEFNSAERKELEKTLEKFPLSITPYYLSLIDSSDYMNDPIFKQSFPSPSELIISKCDMKDPLSEDKDSPAPGITHRYPDRVLFHISNTCSMYCRHC
ncbi:MAG: lysine 2,3-aminomutase, partial [Methanosarcinaceae archaeon]|nr:lysine 2,3-aminomutase [Methanosarcinaceae archaeon]